MIEPKTRGLDLVIWLSAHAAVEELLCSVASHRPWRIIWFDVTQRRTFIYLSNNVRNSFSGNVSHETNRQNTNVSSYPTKNKQRIKATSRERLCFQKPERENPTCRIFHPAIWWFFTCLWAVAQSKRKNQLACVHAQRHTNTNTNTS